MKQFRTVLMNILPLTLIATVCEQRTEQKGRLAGVTFACKPQQSTIDLRRVAVPHGDIAVQPNPSELDKAPHNDYGD